MKGLPCTLSHLHCLLYDTLLQLTWALARDWLITRQHHPQSSSHWDKNILEATEEPYWEDEEDSTGLLKVPDSQTNSWGVKPQHCPASWHHTMSCKNCHNPPQHAGISWDTPCVATTAPNTSLVSCTQNKIPWKVSQIKELPLKLVQFNPLALELDIYSLAHHLCKMWIFYESRRVTLGDTQHFVEE